MSGPDVVSIRKCGSLMDVDEQMLPVGVKARL